MIEIQGKYNTAKVFTNQLDEATRTQIQTLCEQEFVKNSKLRVMPDTHAGAGCVIGTTMTIQDKVVPNLVGVDIGCGMLAIKIPCFYINYSALDEFIRKEIPFGFNANEISKFDYVKEINELTCIRDLKHSASYYNRSIGSLGGGNHFIEVGGFEENNYYLIVHSGSRGLGLQVAQYHQRKAVEYHKGALPKDLCYLEGKLFENYMHDMNIMQKFATLNRETIGKRIIEEFFCLKYDRLESFETIHNYIDMNNMILRKGAVSAQTGEQLLIPMNMRDGSLLCTGLDNPDWNFSAPHGAGRLMSRRKAKENLDLAEFEDTMKNVYSTSVRLDTLDEAPMAYKPMEEIIANIGDTVKIDKIIKPVYNFKA